jgi:Bacterial membrane protein YfhO
MWNTRYIIVAFEANGWRDPPRGSAAFLFQSRQVYPDPDHFTGPNGTAQVANWAETRDFKVIRNLIEYPRSWIVHGARATKPVITGSPDAQSNTMREMLYAADPLWYYGEQRVYDPHVIAWVSRTDLTEIRGYLSGLMPGPSETVKVTYPDPQKAVLEVNLDSPGLVILADVFYPGWELTIDNKSAPIYRVNGSMRGAAVAVGHHRLIYTYSPRSFRIGRLVSIAGLAAMLILGLWCALRPVDPILTGSPS